VILFKIIFDCKLFEAGRKACVPHFQDLYGITGAGAPARSPPTPLASADQPGRPADHASGEPSKQTKLIFTSIHGPDLCLTQIIILKAKTLLYGDRIASLRNTSLRDCKYCCSCCQMPLVCVVLQVMSAAMHLLFRSLL
jgi:hypothetical protein